MSTGPLQSQSMSAFTCSWPAVSHHLLLCGQVSRLRSCKSQSPPLFQCWTRFRQLHRYLIGCAGNLHSAETDSGSRKHDIRFPARSISTSGSRWIGTTTYNAFVRRHGAERDFRTRSEKALIIALRPCVLLFSRGVYSTHSNIYIYFVYLLFFLKQLCKPPNFFKWYYKVHTAGLIVTNTDRQCVSTCDVR